MFIIIMRNDSFAFLLNFDPKCIIRIYLRNGT